MAGWTVLWGVLLIVWLLNPAPEWGKFSGGPVTTARHASSPTKPPDWVLFEYWFAGFAVLAVVWIAAEWWSRREPHVR